MTFIDPALAQETKDKLTSDRSQLGKIYKSKKNAYHVISVDHNLVEGYIQDGWEDFGKPLKTKTKLRKQKKHDMLFEDQVWCQMYDLGYRTLNFDRGFNLPFGKVPGERKQIDVIATDSETVLLIECKSSEKPSKPPSFKTEFEALRLRLDGFQKTLDQLFGIRKKVKYIFATKNLRLDRSSLDVKRLLETKSFFYNDNTYEYINGLLKSYKNAAHYQFQALIFSGQSISKDRIEVPAIEGKMGGKTYYMFSIEPHLLLKLGFVLHRTRANDAEMPTYQRLLVPRRLKGIAKFIEEGGYFPNSVIINFARQTNKIQFEATPRTNDTNSRFGTLKIPNAYAIAYIIDGQHRVYGYAQTSFSDSNTIPVVAFQDLSSTEQLEIFMDINQNQKAVSATLRITLEEDLYWDSDRADSRMKALRSSVISQLTGSISSPLYGKISIGEDKASLSANPFATALTRCGLIPQAKGNRFDRDSTSKALYDTSHHNHEKEMMNARNRIAGFLSSCYLYIEEKYPDVFGKNEKNAIVSNRGTYAFICLIGSLHQFEMKRQKISLESTSEERLNLIAKYLKTLATRLTALPNEEEEFLFGKLGSGAETTWLRYFQNIIHENHPEFEPPELTDWRERQDQELQGRGRRLSTEIERFMKDTIIDKLQKLFGDNWDIEIGSIQRECESRAAKEIEKLYKEGLGRKEIPWTDMFFITDYKTIIEKYWTKTPKEDVSEFKTFVETFSINAGFGFNSKEERIKWISVFNSHRNQIAHEGTKEKGLNKEEIEFIQFIHENLIPGQDL